MKNRMRYCSWIRCVGFCLGAALLVGCQKGEETMDAAFSLADAQKMAESTSLELHAVSEATEDEPFVYADYCLERDEIKIKEFLEQLPEDEEALKAAGYPIVKWNETFNLQRFFAFEERYQEGKESDAILAQYTEQGDLYFDYLYYDTKEVVHYRDCSRVRSGDHWQSGYHSMPYFLSFEQRAEEQDRYKTIGLSVYKDMTYEEFETLHYEDLEQQEISFIASFFYVEEEDK